MYNDKPDEGESLLIDEQDFDRESARDASRSPIKRRMYQTQAVTVVLALLFALSLFYNVLLRRDLESERSRPDMCRSNYSGLAYDTPEVYETNWGQNQTEADEYWNKLDASPVIIALRYEEAAEKYGLERSVQFPWDDEYGIYYIKAYHHIHCLKIIRQAFKSYEHSGKYPGPHEHLYHCLNTLRQDIMCKPDDTLMASIDKPHVIGDKQTVQCRDWNKLTQWATDPVRHGCYKIFDDDRPVANKLELYGFCHEDSPHYGTMKAYFDRHGHKPVYDNSVELED